MAVNLGSLVATITANTAPFSKGMQKAKGDTGKLQKSTKSFSTKTMMVGLAAAAGSALALGKAFGNVKAQMAELDKLGKTSDKLGIGVQQLGQLRFAAEKSGIGVATLDMSLQRMVRRVSEAALGSGEAVKAIAELGINAKDLAAQSPDEQMRTLADALKKVKSPADQVRLAMKLFDSEGVALVNMLKNGSGAIDEQAEAFDRLHGKLSRSDVAAIEEANDAWADTKIAIKGAWVQFAIGIAPVLKLLAQFLTKIVSIGRKVWDIMPWNWFRKSKKAIDEQAGAQAQIAPMLEDQLAKEKAIADEKAKATDELKKQGDAITREFMLPQEKFQEKIDELNNLVNAGAISWSTYNKAVAKTIDELKKANKQTDKLANPRKAIGAVRRGTSAGISAARSSERYMREAKEAQKRQLDEQRETNRILASIDTNTQGGSAVVAVNM